MVIFVGPGVEETLHSTCIELAPYAHQVGGHVGVLALDKQTVCKPHIDQEYQFYNELPRDLVKFVPKFKGLYLATTFHRNLNALMALRLWFAVLVCNWRIRTQHIFLKFYHISFISIYFYHFYQSKYQFYHFIKYYSKLYCNLFR